MTDCVITEERIVSIISTLYKKCHYHIILFSFNYIVHNLSFLSGMLSEKSTGK